MKKKKSSKEILNGVHTEGYIDIVIAQLYALAIMKFFYIHMKTEDYL